MVVLGLEIEAVVNRNKLKDLRIEGYHSHSSYSYGDLWKIETDSSLHEDNEFSNGAPMEFISKKLVGKRKFKKALDVFKIEICKSIPLSKVLAFNSSCGAHVHFSVPGKVSPRAHFRLFEKLRKSFLTKIKNSQVLPNKTKEEIKKQYFRSYSTKLNKIDFLRRSKRKCEFNFTSEESNKGMEWRSINLKGVKTWEELEEVYDIVYSCINKFSTLIQKYNVAEKISFNSTEKKKILSVFDEVNDINNIIKVKLDV